MRKDVQEIFKLTPHDKQVMMFSATLSKDIRPVCKKFMQDVIFYLCGDFLAAYWRMVFIVPLIVPLVGLFCSTLLPFCWMSSNFLFFKHFCSFLCGHICDKFLIFCFYKYHCKYSFLYIKFKITEIYIFLSLILSVSLSSYWSFFFSQWKFM